MRFTITNKKYNETDVAIITLTESKLSNIESPFTELFSSLMRHAYVSEGSTNLMHDSEELTAMLVHLDNATTIVLQGLQDLGLLVGSALQDKKRLVSDFSNIVFFIAAVSNLCEALTVMRSDITFLLEKYEHIAA